CRTAANEDVVSQVRDGWFDVVGLSLACEVLVPRMTEMIAGIRRHSRNPALRVIVGGPVFLADPGRVGQVRADATAHDARQAVH
ncbi:cobalamin-dependent protein, partial [Klebsiella pneumoniae]